MKTSTTIFLLEKIKNSKTLYISLEMNSEDLIKRIETIIKKK